MIAASVAAQEPSSKIKIVASFSILGDLVRNVGGERVEVTTLVGPNGDAHVYSPSPSDAKKVATAAAVVVNGLALEGWMTRLAPASGRKKLIVASQGITPRRMPDEEHAGKTVIDPHAWQSIANAKIYVANIRDGLAAIDPAGKATYEANAAAYLAKLDALETQVRTAMAGIPAERRKIITTHDAFGYFGDAYGVSFIAPEGVATDAEPSAKGVASIIAQIKQQKIPAVFVENITDPRVMDQIARETGARIGGTVYSDALSEPDGPASTYIDMIRHNVSEFTGALRG